MTVSCGPGPRTSKIRGETPAARSRKSETPPPAVHDRHSPAQRDRLAAHGARAHGHHRGRPHPPPPHAGLNALWLPGTDHAGIATQMMVERQLAKEGLTRHDLGREKFIARVWEWKESYHARITSSSRRWAARLDWSRERFTMDDGLSRAVREVFVGSMRRASSTGQTAWSTGRPAQTVISRPRGRPTRRRTAACGTSRTRSALAPTSASWSRRRGPRRCSATRPWPCTRTTRATSTSSARR
jgi:hypothetical protein